MEWPDWWDWEIEISSHCGKRMQERLFNETDLRAILADATEIVEQTHETFLIMSSYENRIWEVIVIPDVEKKMIVVVSAYSVS